jgi:thiosulfate/3-mercaptopyruvate sulfurtransferase
MPGAISLPFTELVEEGRLKTAEKLRELFISKNLEMHRRSPPRVDPEYRCCHRARSRSRRRKDISLYDGSWSQYAQQPEAVIEKTK